MLGFLRRIFNSGDAPERGASPQQVVASEDLERIEEALEGEGRGRQHARLLNRAGDLYLVKGDRRAALKHYGDAIDSYLQAGEYDNAMAVCRKIIRVVPEVIRTRRTLAWLCLGKGFLEIAREHVEAYVDASLDAGLEALAIQQIQLMAQYVDREDFREFLAVKLEELEDAEAAKRVREGHASGSVRAGGWTPVVFAAMLTPEELKRAADKGVEIKAPSADTGQDEFESLIFDFDHTADDRAAKTAAAADESGEAEPDGDAGADDRDGDEAEREAGAEDEDEGESEVSAEADASGEDEMKEKTAGGEGAA